ncbi:MAG: lipopolysaccharide heptosyltransferase II [Chloroflexi bacterium]|nr:lipopolysaccharide heptosyltransferase II [Chloroflexota bacterium]
MALLLSLAYRLLSLVFSPFRSHIRPDFSPRSILVLKPCCIGDVLMATPAIAALRARYPDARISAAVGPWSRPVLEGNPHLDGLFDLGDTGNGRTPGLIPYLRLALRLRRAGFAACVVLDRSPLWSLLPWLAGIPVRVGIDSGGRGFSLSLKVQPLAIAHEARLYLDVAKMLGATCKEPRLEYVPSAGDVAWAREQVNKAWPDRQAESRVVAIHPAGGANPGTFQPSKRWPTERYAALAANLASSSCYLIFTGSADDAELVNEVREALGPAWRARSLDVTGRTTLGQLASLYSLCSLFVGGDSGPLHLAEAVGTPVVALFGPTDPAIYGPLARNSITLYKSEGCPACAGGDSGASHTCMAAIEEDEVWRAACHLLDGRSLA